MDKTKKDEKEEIERRLAETEARWDRRYEEFNERYVGGEVNLTPPENFRDLKCT